ncbi:hypothetical protein [Actinomadura nitritigenes]|uniref:Uncharacterized protein n=1 Tax=Actinomadura nitritigenes TaxID=134602 RepID=A0ABS3R1X0_9ACTN|nr:hypothetical protein [Actinomadura nitritigenes]MBO2440235.1 hypothetical protein [Actinomadura nitritigenes]
MVLLGTLVDSGGELALAAAQLSDVTATLTAPATRPLPRTAESHRAVMRARLGVTCHPGKARKIADRAILKAARVKNNPPAWTNVALEYLVQASLELLAFSTLRWPPAHSPMVPGRVTPAILRGNRASV